jgi:hypothetical protein
MFCISIALFNPWLPVQAFAMPELTTIARMFVVLDFSVSRLSVTGAPTTWLVVNIPAAAQLFVEWSSIKSGFPEAFIPQVAVPTWNP